MKPNCLILLVLLFILSGCSSGVSKSEISFKDAESSVIIDKVDSDLMMLYDATASNRNAIEHEVSASAPTCQLRIINQNRNRNTNQNLFYIKTIAAHLPDSIKMSHHPICFLFALSKEYHVFRLRRILI